MRSLIMVETQMRLKVPISARLNRFQRLLKASRGDSDRIYLVSAWIFLDEASL